MAVLIQGDARSIPLRSNSVQCIVTSPPYFGLREYGDSEDEIGRETLQSYLNDMHYTLQECRRVLKDDGILWLNIGDTASGSGGSGGDYNRGGKKEGKRGFRQGETSIPKGSWCSVPHRVVIDAVDNGEWLLRSDIAWSKGQVRPESVAHVKRPLIEKESIFMLTKQVKVKWNGSDNTLGDVWVIPPAKGKNGSPAPFPEALPARCIALSTDEGDVVFDPFAGGNTTAIVAESMGRIGIGMDLYGGRFQKNAH